MTVQRIITLTQISDYFNVDIEIIRDFAEFSLYPTLESDGETGIEPASLGRLCKIISLYQSLGVNKEGIDIILDLREKVSLLQDQVESLQRAAEWLRYDLYDEGPAALKGRGLTIEIED